MLRVLQLLISSAGIAVIVWAYFDLRFSDAEGFLEGVFCLPFSAGVALIILGWTVSERLRRPAFWFALAMVGQAVALQMIDAGPRGEYQHYLRPISRLIATTHPLILILFAVQTALVLSGIRSHSTDISEMIGRFLKGWRLLIVGLIFFLTSSTISFFPDKTLSYEIPVYMGELCLSTFIQLINLGNVFLVVWNIPEDILSSLKGKFDKYFSRSGKDEILETGSIDNFAVVAAAWVTALAAILSFFSYERIPHLPDEIAYLYHARYFAEGMLSMPAPPVPEAFHLFLMEHAGNSYYSVQLPGWPAMLSLGVLFEVPWLVNPILAGLNILIAYLFILEIYDRRTARIVVFLLCFSPWYVFMAMNFMGHTFALTCSLSAAMMVIMARNTGNAVWGWIGGFFTGILSLVRPLEALVIAGLLGLWAIGFGGKRLKYSAIAGLVLGSLIIGSVTLYYNYLLTGDPTILPYSVHTDKHFGPGSNSLGFGPKHGMGWPTLDPLPGHGLMDVLINANFNFFSVNIELFGWSTGSLILLAVFLFSGAMKRSDYIMLAVIGSIIGIHSIYWSSGGPDFGARIWYLIIVPCVALSVKGIHYLASRIESGKPFVTFKGTRVLVGVILMCILTLVNYFPWRAIDKYHHFRHKRPDIYILSKEYDFKKSLILIRGNNHYDYASAAIYNPTDFKDDKPIYAWDKSPEIRKQLLKNYSEKKIWIVNGPTITHKGYEVVAGPFSAQELL